MVDNIKVFCGRDSAFFRGVFIRGPIAGGGHKAGFTLVEVLLAMGLLVLMGAGLIYGYVRSARMTDWQAHSLAAQSFAMQRIEQARAAKWDTQAGAPVDQLVSSNFPPLVGRLGMPVSGTNFVFATDYTTISSVSSTPPLRMIQVDCAWQFTDGKIFTNTVVTYRAPDE